MGTEYQSVRDYIAARERIKNEVITRYETGTTDSAELIDLGRAMEISPGGEA